MTNKLTRTAKPAEEVLTPEELLAGDRFCEGYRAFLAQAKTERECVTFFLKQAQSAGFVPLDSKRERAYAPGTKLLVNIRGKALVLIVMGQKNLEEGVRLTAAHLDSPRLDLKPQPFYEDKGFALAKTHYYGGIKKYQWVTIPLALHGVVVKTDGSVIPVVIGEAPEDPKFCISDLLPHLGKEQAKRTLTDGITGEELNIILGARKQITQESSSSLGATSEQTPQAKTPETSETNSDTKLHILKLLQERYGITELDFVSAELSAVPAFPPCDIGLDRALIGAYGHDDRVCAYPCATALLELAEIPAHTSIAVLADKEEIGSYGNTGLGASFLEDVLAELSRLQNANPRTVRRNTKCLSTDVNVGFDPTFPGVLDAHNAAYLGHGVVLTKYTGSRGKSGCSDASAEYMAFVRNVLDTANVLWQPGELGKVDEGGGGTVAVELARLGMEVVDLGVPLLSMHAPFELAAKSDIAMLRRACSAFYHS